MSRREALAALARRYPEEYRRIYAALKDGRPVDEVTVTEWAEQWLTMRERIVRPGSLAADKAAVTKWIIPTVGARPLAGLQRSDIRAVHASAETAGLAASSVSRIHVVTMKMLGDAVDEGHDVPERTRRTPSPAVGVSGRQALTVDAARAVLRVAMERPDSSRWVAAILQGMRPAEARGLRWSAIDLDRGTMTIEWQLKPLPYRYPRRPDSGFRVPRGFESIHLTGSQHLVRPKTASGVRVVPLVPWLRTELAAWSAIAPDSPHGLVWTQADGQPLWDTTDRDRWNAIVEAADVWVTQADGTRRRPLLYEARHTAATLLMQSGVDETTLTAIVGHSKIASTAAYLHADESRKLAALTLVAEQLGVAL